MLSDLLAKACTTVIRKCQLQNDNSHSVALAKDGSPNWSIDRTFTITVYFPKEPQKLEKPRRSYRNPIHLAKKYRWMIDSGQARNESDLARQIGVSRVRVNQIIRLLKLDTQIIRQIENLGDPLLSQIITERMLRPYIGLPFKKQKTILQIIKS